MSLQELGFSDWFMDQVDPAQTTEYKIARVIAVNKDNYALRNNAGDALAEVTGKLMYGATSPLDYPAVGDWVYAQYLDENSFAIIHQIMPRKSSLQRKTAGKKIEFQLIAANIDTAFIVQSLDANYNLRRLERYLVMVNQGNIYPVILLCKSDLISADELEQKIAQIHKLMPDVKIAAFSNISDSGLDDIKALLISGNTYCMIGSSGVGKTTLLNNLLGGEMFEVQAVDKDDKGRHTTTRRQLIRLENGAMIIDTPGMRELGNFAVDSGLSDTFAEIVELAVNCRYADCTHSLEEGCAVLQAVKDKVIEPERHENYVKMNKESAFNEMSYLEKRQKDKDFGKMIQTYKKQFGMRKKR
ncbi:MAG: ribosome small subunit-dependent GTPase A [Chloroflexi bacterium]|jgi:ribosome biogenesis GTPase / thiamine phosphate phosphatase|nr:ribosome small subunit-dependent GTPase A [Chloroflexota bacterium]MBT7081487.1 ribosome small subunit-dependent GTPase A [Chloroflexota bacterium]MBT7290695.1 ribosome small subunit-dependent GTPase A [Chloroflexota bacterium]